MTAVSAALVIVMSSNEYRSPGGDLGSWILKVKRVQPHLVSQLRPRHVHRVEEGDEGCVRGRQQSDAVGGGGEKTTRWRVILEGCDCLGHDAEARHCGHGVHEVRRTLRLCSTGIRTSASGEAATRLVRSCLLAEAGWFGACSWRKLLLETRGGGEQTVRDQVQKYTTSLYGVHAALCDKIVQQSGCCIMTDKRGRFAVDQDPFCFATSIPGALICRRPFGGTNGRRPYGARAMASETQRLAESSSTAAPFRSGNAYTFARQRRTCALCAKHATVSSTAKTQERRPAMVSARISHRLCMRLRSVGCQRDGAACISCRHLFRHGDREAGLSLLLTPPPDWRPPVRRTKPAPTSQDFYYKRSEISTLDL